MALVHGLVLGVGGLLVSIPIVLHLLMQPKPKLLTFPALRFVKQTQRTNQRRLRLRHWILLLLRCLLIAALVAGFARPSTPSANFGNWLSLFSGGLLSLLAALLLIYTAIWSKPANVPLSVVLGLVLALLAIFTASAGFRAAQQQAGHIPAGKQAPVAAVLLVDSSPRMMYRNENQSLLQRAKDHGQWLINQLPAGSQVSVVPTDGSQPFFCVDLSAARKRLSTLRNDYSTSHVSESLTDAVELLEKSELQLKEIYIFSDLTRQSFPQVGDSLSRLFADHAEISVFIIDVGMLDPNNLSLSPLQLSATSIPTHGQLEIQTQVRAQGPGRSIVGRLMLERPVPDSSRPIHQDGKTLVPEQHWIRLVNDEVADDSVTELTFSLQEELPPGIHHGWIELEGGDSLSIDDRRYFTIEVRPSWKVLIAHPSGVDPEILRDVIAPGQDENSAANAFDCKIIEQRDLAAEQQLADYRTIFLLDPHPMTDSMWLILHQYVSEGGGLGIFLGRRAEEADQNQGSFTSETAASVLPGPLVRVWRREADNPVVLTLSDLTHPALKRFRPLATQGIWQSFPIYRFWELDLNDQGDSTVIARFSNGLPALLERQIDRGHVLCMTTPITEQSTLGDSGSSRSWNDLFSSYRSEPWPAWLLVSELASYLASGTRQPLNLLVDQMAVLQNDLETFPTDYYMFAPDDQEPARVTADLNTLRYKFTNLPGTYRLKGEKDGPMLRGFSVNLAPGTTDLTRVEPKELDELLGKDRFQLARERDQIQRQQGTARIGQEFYPILVLMMCLCLALELAMSNRFYRKAA